MPYRFVIRILKHPVHMLLNLKCSRSRISRKYRISEITRQSADSFPWDQIRGITINQKLADNKISLIICLGVWQVGSHYTLPPFFPRNLHPSKIPLVGKWADPSRWTPFEASINSEALLQMSLIVLKSWFRFECGMWVHQVEMEQIPRRYLKI